MIGKRKRADVLIFERYLEDNLFTLYSNLKDKTYQHGDYESFYVRDPKLRHIHKALVRDRVVHHLVSSILEKIFEKTFYTHSYSCRVNKGTHKAVETFISFSRKASQNNTSPLFVLKCDIKKFFASVDQQALIDLLKVRIKDPDFMWLLEEVIESFNTEESIGPLFPAKGMPIGNLTSQLFANIYLDPFDQFIKHQLNVKYYIRYADDFVIMSEDKQYLDTILVQIKQFLGQNLKLSLHPNKISIRSYYLGIDFLGYIVFPHFVLPRTKTRRRIFKKMFQEIQLAKGQEKPYNSLRETLDSYLGYLSHANAYKLSRELKNQVWFWLSD